MVGVRVGPSFGYGVLDFYHIAFALAFVSNAVQKVLDGLDGARKRKCAWNRADLVGLAAEMFNVESQMLELVLDTLECFHLYFRKLQEFREQKFLAVKGGSVFENV